MKLHKVKPRSWKEEMVEPGNEKRYPRFHIDDDNLPEVNDWKIGKFYKITMTVKQTTASEKHGAEFEIHEIGGEESDYKESSKGKAKTSPERYPRSTASPEVG